MNKSRVARDLWRKVFNDNLIDLKDSDARKQVVREFLNDPVNKKAGWKSKDARFFRLGFNKVAKENNILLMVCDACAVRRGLAEGPLEECGSGNVKAKGLVEGVGAGCFPQLYGALGPNPPDQVITL